MRILKLVFFSIIIIFGVVTIISLFIPSEIRVAKLISIQTVPVKLWAEIDDLKQWSRWNPFFSDTVNQKIEYLDTSNGRVTAMKVDNTVITWKEMKTNEHIAEMQNDGHQLLVTGWKILPYTNPDSLIVQWYTDFHLRWYPWEKFSSLLFEKIHGSRMQQGLENLKALLEK